MRCDGWTRGGRREGGKEGRRGRLNRIWISFNTTKAAQRKTTRKARQTDETAGCDVRYLRLAERFHGLWSAAMPVPCAKMHTHQYQYLKNYKFNVSAIAGNLQYQKAMSPKCKSVEEQGERKNQSSYDNKCTSPSLLFSDGDDGRRARALKENNASNHCKIFMVTDCLKIH